MKKILECSSRGDKRFSAFYAEVTVFGKFDTIERHYQNCKRDSNGRIPGKGKHVAYMVLTNEKGEELKLPATYLTAFYKLMWTKYLDARPSLVKYADKYDDFTDMFSGRCINNQANVIKQYVKQGRQSIMTDPDVMELCRLIKEWKSGAECTQ